MTPKLCFVESVPICANFELPIFGGSCEACIRFTRLDVFPDGALIDSRAEFDGGNACQAVPNFDLNRVLLGSGTDCSFEFNV